MALVSRPQTSKGESKTARILRGFVITSRPPFRLAMENGAGQLAKRLPRPLTTSGVSESATSTQQLGGASTATLTTAAALTLLGRVPTGALKTTAVKPQTPTRPSCSSEATIMLQTSEIRSITAARPASMDAVPADATRATSRTTAMAGLRPRAPRVSQRQQVPADHTARSIPRRISSRSGIPG